MIFQSITLFTNFVASVKRAPGTKTLHLRNTRLQIWAANLRMRVCKQ